MLTDFIKFPSTNFNEINSAGFKLFHAYRQKNRAILTDFWQVFEFVYRQTDSAAILTGTLHECECA